MPSTAALEREKGGEGAIRSVLKAFRHPGAYRGHIVSLPHSREDKSQAPKGKVTCASDRAYNGATGTSSARLPLVSADLDANSTHIAVS